VKMETTRGKNEFAKRKEAVEWPLGSIKENLKYTEFLTRDINQTTTKNNLISISHNLKRIYKENQTKITIQNQQNT
ncbi:MAG: transposase, partial [Candidatus Subteraquimicrobiales bacterium]|nr:transposase [Candidatus Subteraquimicrobiales bacterium]